MKSSLIPTDSTFKENYADFNKNISLMNRSFTMLNHTKTFSSKDFISEFIRFDGIYFLCLCFTYFLQMDDEHYNNIDISEKLIKCTINVLDFVIMIIEQVSLRSHIEQIESFFYYFSAFLEKVNLPKILGY
jgi:hypothetical protein